MTAIEFSFIPDAETDYQMIVRLISTFKRETGIEVDLKRMEWDDVWLQLIPTGRSYRTIALWHRIEHQLGMERGAMAAKLFQDPNMDLDTLVTEAMDSLAYGLNPTLE